MRSRLAIPSPLKRWNRSLSVRIFSLFTCLLLLLATAQFFLAYSSWLLLLQHYHQQQHWLLAREVAQQAGETLATKADYQALATAIASRNSPRVLADFYLVREDGSIETAFIDHPLYRHSVSAQDIRKFIEATSSPIPSLFRIDDPRTPRGEKVFSAHQLEIQGQTAYLLAILTTTALETSNALLAQSFVIRNSLAAFCLSVSAAALLGFVLFRRLTLPFRTLLRTVEQFREGRLETRYPLEAKFDVGVLGATFNEMADTLAIHIEQLKNTDALRRELVASISHDLRTPLTSIRGFVDMLLKKGDSLDAGSRERYLAITLGSIDSLARLIDDLFELSKLEARQKPPDWMEFFIDELADDVVRSMQGQALQKGIDFRLDSALTLCSIEGDPGMLERVLVNLLGNAFQYTPSGGSVTVSLAVIDDVLEIKVRDTGEGIPESALPYLFDRFYRADQSRNADRGGAGLGLAIVKKIVELHNGNIRVESSLGAGSCFIVMLPLRQSLASSVKYSELNESA